MDDRTDNAVVEAGRKRARRTALWIGLVAAAIYAAFILSGVIGRAH
ncbi:hypothetical protein [Lysobacter soyae]|uniref:Uncharacterized protein n=1 Tax=Lysobacter soyae TaxID=2764185 RepID=A0ABX8WQD7_9GAMM|nr:hypothetical protein [Lysobacter sp. CJ11]QYR52944.1 hypothetical protein H8L67_10320 [Lysobacter sp. CJ11]